jgi:glutamyl-tRNA reductase
MSHELAYSYDDMKKLTENMMQAVEKTALQSAPLIAAVTLEFFANILPHMEIRTDSEVARKGAEAMRQAIIHQALNTAQMLREMPDSDAEN